MPEISEFKDLGFRDRVEYSIFGEGYQISTNPKRENNAFSLLIG